MEGTLFLKGRFSYEKRHFCVEQDENGELCLVGRIKSREGKVEKVLLENNVYTYVEEGTA